MDNIHALPSLASIPTWRLAAVLVLLSPVLFALGFYLYVTPNSFKDSRRKHLPPGPRGLPFIGNFFPLSNAETFRFQAQKWAKQYGDVFYTKMGGADYIYLSSPTAVKELMDKKSGIYSSRPPAPLASDVASAGRRQLFMPYGPKYRVVRKIAHSLLNISISTSYQPVQDVESKQLMYDLLHDPIHFYDHNRRYSNSVIMTVAYGHRMADWDNPLTKKIYSVVNNLQVFSAPGAFLVDTFPTLQHFPQWMFGNWRKFGEKCFNHDSRVYLGLWGDLKKEVDQGKANPCFAKDFYLSDPAKVGLDELQAAYQTGGLVEAGSETTSAYLNSFILNMTANPHVMRKAQEEVDRVVGPNRLPSWEDEPNLPYLRAIIKELLRMRPPNKFGMQHYTTEDDWYEGYFIPKDTVVVLNWWHINYDPAHWDQPEKFMPERFLGYDLPAAAYINIADPNERDHYSYGAGRRICPGVHVAEKSLYLNIARVLWAFDIAKKVGSDGKIVEPDASMVPGWMTIPVPFECDIRVRDEKKKALIDQIWKEAKKELKE
ncbi:cytochrome P450 [Exophiala viscosa]|uniref:cytochrome P450 n=1 Tax=Exophiala viscosa TaxID=2486360 RepID=UPI00218EABFB|nr:cytochrome P450 [Exophiala viscosa]